MTEMKQSDRELMGTPDEAKEALIDKARAWRELRQPRIATAKEHKRIDALEREAKFQLANAALLWLWHQENPSDGEKDAPDVAAKAHVRTHGEET